MRYVAAYLLAALGGKASPKASDLKKILNSVGVDVDDSEVQTVVDNLDGKDIEELIAEGMGKLGSMPATGGGGGAAAGGAAAGGAAEEKVEEKKEESEEESDDDMGFGLFD
eukprot:TRINITY_DN18178_c0_g1_i1.p1 TRINITY_DN18178_c0_g1~~TRINITY_DN18178_c0_g1_i1.p1  ORF type:complete len:111 (+),score=35.30 TRINITY_DN18178_c0_g1_i1:63-395(+)